MYIAMILEAPFPPDIRVENEARALVKAGHTIHVFALSFGTQSEYEKYAENIFVHRLKLPKWFFNKMRVTLLRLPFYNFFWLKFLYRRASQLKLEAVHIHDIPLAKVGATFAKKRNIPVVLDLHENYPAALKIWNFSQKMFGAYFLNIDSWIKYENEYVCMADKVIVVVEEARERLLQNGIAKNKVHVISNTLNFENFLPDETTATDKSNQPSLDIVYAGGFGPHRGLNTAIAAMPEILSAAPYARLILVGEGAGREELEDLVKNLKLEGHVEFLGWRPLKELPAIIGQSDIGIVPHASSEHTDTTVPHKLFQYMYLKKPVVVSDCKPLERIVNGTGAGLVHAAGDSKDYAHKILQLQDEKLRRDLGEQGHKAVMRRYNWAVDAQKLVEIYAGLAA